MNKDLTVGKSSTVLWKFCLPLFGAGKHGELKTAVHLPRLLVGIQHRR